MTDVVCLDSVKPSDKAAARPMSTAAGESGSEAVGPTRSESTIDATSESGVLVAETSPSMAAASAAAAPQLAAADEGAAPVRAAAASLKHGNGKPAPGPCDNTDVPRARTLSGLDCGGWITFLFPYCAVR